MIPAALRQDHRWWQRAQTKPPSLPPMVVGGVPIEEFVPSVPTCPEPGCGLTNRDAELVYVHAMETHFDRRRQPRTRDAA